MQTRRLTCRRSGGARGGRASSSPATAPLPTCACGGGSGWWGARACWALKRGSRRVGAEATGRGRRRCEVWCASLHFYFFSCNEHTLELWPAVMMVSHCSWNRPSTLPNHSRWMSSKVSSTSDVILASGFCSWEHSAVFPLQVVWEHASLCSCWLC